MSFPPRFLDDIRNRLTLSDIIGRRIPVKRAGREHKACCPFHKEKTPSFTINDDKQFYHCFGCGAHGDVIGFVMQHDNLSFMDAVETLAADAGLQMPKPDPMAAKKAEKQRGLHELMDEATKWMQEQAIKPENNDVLNYLEQRGMNEAVRNGFKLGYAPADGQALRKAMIEKGFKDEQMLEVGILKKSTRGGDPYVFFRDRVMFPVADRRGRVVAFGGRILPEHIRPTNPNSDYTPAKYINSSDTPLFDKGQMLYAESIARQAAREGHSILVTEGYMDVIACHKAGFKGAVAPMGTALTEEQILSLWQMIPDGEKSPVLCFDGDRAGREAASRACQRILPLLKPDQSARFAFLPDGEDPDSLIRGQGAVAFKSFLQAALPLFDFIWATNTAGRQLETPEQRAGLEKTLYEDVAKIQDTNIQRHYKNLVRDKISETFFSRNYKKRSGGSAPKLKRPGANVVKLRKPQRGNHDIKHRILLAAVLNYPIIYNTIEESFGGFELDNQMLNNIRQSIILALEENPDLDAEGLQTHFTDQGLGKEIRDICCESVYVHAAFCRPALNEDIDYGEIAQNWLALYESLKTGVVDEEIRDGWKQAMVSANQDEEEKLSNMIKNRGRDDEFHQG